MAIEMSTFAQTVYEHKYELDGEGWEGTAARVAHTVMDPYLPDLADEVEELIRERKFIPGGRYLYATGRPFNQTQNCLLLTVEDSREGWASLMSRVTSGSMTGAGLGTVYSNLREEGAVVNGMGGTSTGPIALMKMVNEAGRYIMQGGSRRVALWAGLHWSHPDALKFVKAKDWSEDVRRLKELDFNFPADLDMTNISVILDDEFFEAYHDENAGHPRLQHPKHEWAVEVYDTTVRRMLKTGEPGFSIDVGPNAGEHLRNACTEITSADDNDICNLGSINLARIDSLEEMRRVVRLSTAFLLCGTLYSKVPYEEVAETREKNRRLGLGLMGVHEWLLKRGYRYEPNYELEEWLTAYEIQSDAAAKKYATDLGISIPVKVRAIAPAGTISIIGETTSGMEPLLAVAYKRRYLKGQKWHYQYVVDATAQRLVEQGVNPDDIEDAYSLAGDYRRRLEMQAFLQGFVDHGISSTLNLPPYGEGPDPEEFGRVLMEYLPRLRGVTVYPSESRGGQPITRVPYTEAVIQAGVEYEEFSNESACVGGVCGL